MCKIVTEAKVRRSKKVEGLVHIREAGCEMRPV